MIIFISGGGLPLVMANMMPEERMAATAALARGGQDLFVAPQRAVGFGDHKIDPASSPW